PWRLIRRPWRILETATSGGGRRDDFDARIAGDGRGQIHPTADRIRLDPHVGNSGPESPQGGFWPDLCSPRAPCDRSCWRRVPSRWLSPRWVAVARTRTDP